MDQIKADLHLFYVIVEHRAPVVSSSISIVFLVKIDVDAQNSTKTRGDQIQSKGQFCAQNETIKCVPNKMTVESKKLIKRVKKKHWMQQTPKIHINRKLISIPIYQPDQSIKTDGLHSFTVFGFSLIIALIVFIRIFIFS